MDEQITELEKLQQAAQLIEEMSQGRLQIRPSVAGLVYIRPQDVSNLGMDMRIDSIPGQPRYRITFAAQLRRMGTDMDADGLRVLLSEVGQLYALLAALEARSYTPNDGRPDGLPGRADCPAGKAGYSGIQSDDLKEVRENDH